MEKQESAEFRRASVCCARKMKRFLSSVLTVSFLYLFPRSAPCIEPHATFDDLKKLEILCYVPAWLPKYVRNRREEYGSERERPDR